MTTRQPARRLAERIIRRACRRVPAATRDERYREWTAELPAILSDPDVDSAVRRSARALRYAAGVARSTRRLHPPAEPASGDTGVPGLFPRPDGVIPALAAVVVWGAVLGLARAFPAIFSPADPWLPAAVAATFVPGILVVAAIVRFVLWIRRRSRRTPAP